MAEHGLFNDFDGTADRKIELAVSAPLIDGDFGKSVRLEFSYQKAVPGGRSLQVPARSNTRPATIRRALRGSVSALSPLIALP